MGFNFRKRIRLGKYANLNIGKSGLSLSVGRKGMRQSISTKGVSRTTFSLPGTGLSYSKSLNAKKLLKGRGMGPILGNREEEQEPEKEVQAFQEDIKFITTLHHYEDYPSGISWEEIKNEEAPFKRGEVGPHTKEAQRIIEENKPGFLKRLFASGGFKASAEKLLHEAKELDDELFAAWTNNKVLAEKMLHHDEKAYLAVLEDLGFSKVLEEYIKEVAFSYVDGDSLKGEVSIEVASFLPESYKTLTPTGRLSMKKYTKTEYYDIASMFVSGIAYRLGKNLFHLLPVADVLLNVYQRAVNTHSGVLEQKRILSVLFDRQTFEAIDLAKGHPFDHLQSFKHEVKFVKTRGFGEVPEVQ